MHTFFGNRVVHLCVLCLALLLGSLAGSVRANEAVQPSEEKLFFYFGSAGNVKYGFARFNEDCSSPTSDPNDRQIMHVATHTNAVMELGWGDWLSPKGRQAIADCKVKRLIEAKAFGIEVGIVSIDFLLWEPILNGSNPAPHFYRGDDVVIPELRSFFRQLERNGVIGMVDRGYCYIMDEPALYGITGADMERAIATVQKVASEFDSLRRCKTYVIYNYGQYPGISSVDMAGQDHYDIGSAVVGTLEYERFRSMLRRITDASPQWMSVVPGGAFGQDPTPFLERVLTDPQAKALNAFIFFDGWAEGRLGIHGNGMAESYCTAGKKVIDPEVAEPDCTSPPPEVSLTVNGAKQVTVAVGDELCYRWQSTGATVEKFTSYWWSSNPSCSYGLNGGRWVADSAEGEFCWPVDSAQAGCTYTITYAGIGKGRTSSASAIGVTIKDPNQKQ